MNLRGTYQITQPGGKTELAVGFTLDVIKPRMGVQDPQQEAEPEPMKWGSWKRLAAQLGLTDPEQISTVDPRSQQLRPLRKGENKESRCQQTIGRQAEHSPGPSPGHHLLQGFCKTYKPQPTDLRFSAVRDPMQSPYPESDSKNLLEAKTICRVQMTFG